MFFEKTRPSSRAENRPVSFIFLGSLRALASFWNRLNGVWGLRVVDLHSQGPRMLLILKNAGVSLRLLRSSG